MDYYYYLEPRFCWMHVNKKTNNTQYKRSTIEEVKMGREREIVKQFDLCATLMSDPDMLRKYPEIVANQFYVTKNSVETLGTFLAPRPTIAATAVDPCGCHAKNWLDLSIISKGVGQLVAKTLDTHMGVVRRGDGDFPEIVREDFKIVVDKSENYFIREIKESACMGAVVLLYYYLDWYLFLILMNKRFSDDASYCSQEKLDIRWLREHLPKAFDFLEFKHTGGGFMRNMGETVGNFNDRTKKAMSSGAVDKFMFGMPFAGKDEQERKTMLVAAYRLSLSTNLKGLRSEFDFDTELPVALLDKSASFIFNLITTDITWLGMAVMGGMTSVFERQNAIQKWEDMHSPVQVGLINASKHQETATARLAKILSQQPYSASNEEWKEKGRKACLYDYCSASVMMDVCRSFQKLSDLVNSLSHGGGEGVLSGGVLFPKLLISFLSNLSGLSRERIVIESLLGSKEARDSNGLRDEEYASVNKTDDTRLVGESMIRLGSDRTARATVPLWMDKFKCLYPSKSCTSSNEVNHKCFLWDLGGGKHKRSDALLIIQDELLKFKSVENCNAYALAILCPLLRNTWTMTYGTESANELLRKLTTVPFFMQVSLNLAAEDNEIYDDDAKAEVYTGGRVTAEMLAALKKHHITANSGFLRVIRLKMIQELAKVVTLKANIHGVDGDLNDIEHDISEFGTRIGEIPITLTSILEFTAKQRTALAALVQESNKFYRYPALMWPVKNGRSSDNRANFPVVRNRQKQPSLGTLESNVGSIAVSAHRLANVTEGLVGAFAHNAIPPAAAPPPAAPGPGPAGPGPAGGG